MAVTSDVDICNLALAHLGLNGIQSLIEDSTQAKECNRVYEQCRDELFETHQWNFASRVKQLAEHTEDPPADWAYRYEYPSDCIRPIEVLEPEDDTVSSFITTARDLREAEASIPIAFVTEMLADGSARTILTDQDNARLRYVFQNVDVPQYTPLFKQALSWRIAAEIALPLTRKPPIQENAEAKFRILMSNAIAQHENSMFRGRGPDAEAIRARR